MPPKKQKRGLENAGDVSISRAPAPTKKQKAVELEPAEPGPRTGKTRSATKSSVPNDAGDAVDTENPPAEPIKIKLRPKLKQPSADEPVPTSQDDTSAAAPPPPKEKKGSASRQSAAVAQDAAEVEVAPAPPPAKNKGKQVATPKEPVTKVSTTKSNKDNAPAPLSPQESRKSNRAKKPSEIAEKVNEQEVAKQNVKESKAAKKVKKAEAAVIVETPEETAAVLAQLKGASQPVQTSPPVTSPPRKKKQVDRAKAMEQLISFPSPNPSVVSGVSASTGANTRTSSLGPSDSVSQTNASQSRKPALPSLQVPKSGSASRNVSPTAPPSLSLPSSIAASRDVTPSAESAVTVNDDHDDDGARVHFDTILSGVGKPFNLGPILPPPELPAPFHHAALKPEILQQLTAGGKDKGKPIRTSINNFREEDGQHLKLSLEYMDALIATVCAFPDDDTVWTFALLSNHWASQKLKRNYRLKPDSEHFRALSSRISQSRSKLVSSNILLKLGDHYPELRCPLFTEGQEAEKERVQEEIRQKTTEMIESGSYLAPANNPAAYFQHPWLAYVIKNVYYKGTGAKGCSPAHAAHFGGGLSYSLLAAAATASEHLLTISAIGSSTSIGFSHKLYYGRFDSHLLTLKQLDQHAIAGPKLRKYLTKLHEKWMGKTVTSVAPTPGLRLTIPIAALDNYAEAAEPQPAADPDPAPSSSNRPIKSLANLLEDPALSGNQKLNIVNAIYGVTQEILLDDRRGDSTRSSRQYRGLLTEVNVNDDGDSEAEARRAGALPDTGNTGPTGQAWADSDSEMAEGGEKGEGESKGVGKPEEESEEESGNVGRSKGGDNAESDSDGDVERAKRDATMLDIEDSSSEEDGASVEHGAEGGADDAGQGVGAAGADDEDEEDQADEATKARTRRFFSANGDPISDDGEDSDGEGAAGTVPLPVDADATMQTVDESDNE
ncbi:hypothetical protein FRC09_010015 [Ceratobasidium sp. 395]|nr:hypothetical protein FRC09_010015 [Ceratobasidium sp. 395]